MAASSGKEIDFIARKRKRLSIKQVDQSAEESITDKRGIVRTNMEKPILELINGKRKVSIVGTSTKRNQTAGESKKLQEKGNARAEFHMGVACRKGLKPQESPNQDDFCIYRSDDTGIYAVFDGHGPYGHDVSDFVRMNLPRLLLENPVFESDPKDALHTAFTECHTACVKAGYIDCTRSGTTATLIVHRAQCLYVAHVGDSRAVCARKRSSLLTGVSTWLEAKELTQDHKPELPQERRRIERSGGTVLRLEDDIPFRVFIKGKAHPGLAMSRSIGDTDAASVGVSNTPDVSTFQISEDLKFILLCSDGVWEFISSQEAVDIIAKFPCAEVQKATEQLADESTNRWVREEDDVVDDITAICVWLNDP